MTTYTAYYYTTADYARHSFEADTPEQALQLARSFYEGSLSELSFQSYDHIEPLDHLEIWDPDRVTCASWQSQDYHLRHAAPGMLAALEQAVAALNTAPRFRVPGLDTDSYKIAAICDRAIARARPEPE